MARIGARQIYILPTRSGLFFGFLVISMLIGSLNYQNNLGLLFTFFFGSVALVAMHHCWFNLLGLAVQARPGPPTFAGDAARFEVILRSARRSGRYDLEVLGGLETAGPVALEPGDQVTLGILKPSVRRGHLSLNEVVIQTHHPMGLFRAWSHVSCRTRVLVYPRPAARAPTPRGTGGTGYSQVPSGGEGADDYLGPREYRVGDSPRHLDWKALARGRGLVVKQFGGELGRDQWIDWAGSPIADPERRISLLTRQVLNAGEVGSRFGLRLPGREVPLGRGEAQIHRCLRALALHEPGDTQGRPRKEAA